MGRRRKQDPPSPPYVSQQRPHHGQILLTGEDLYYALMGSGMAGWLADPRMLKIKVLPYPLRVIHDPSDPLDHHRLKLEPVKPPDFHGDFI